MRLSQIIFHLPLCFGRKEEGDEMKNKINKIMSLDKEIKTKEEEKEKLKEGIEQGFQDLIYGELFEYYSVVFGIDDDVYLKVYGYGFEEEELQRVKKVLSEYGFVFKEILYEKLKEDDELPRIVLYFEKVNK